MGLSVSKRVEKSLQDSPEFDAACNSVFEECLEMAQHIDAGVRLYQLAGASERLHQRLYSSSLQHRHLLKKWLQSPPNRTQIDKAIKVVIERFKIPSDGGETLNLLEFKAFAVELFTDAIVSNAGKVVLRKIPIGLAGIIGIGAATRSGRDLVGIVMGIYSLGVATAVYVSLSEDGWCRFGVRRILLIWFTSS
ncbi:uncharacterized protein LOC122091886 isoform X2 [Macadamia integrifolia]|uniref:uncharacterized protein LOC122091886 isoform X2 n=1 Tax=Macadamia integrifolia TaxID=60698 RepID=UPI001C4F6779|nr:uncharacterized protein LOC122091886 isoform X2 [Macadamia integrifolia]